MSIQKAKTNYGVVSGVVNECCTEFRGVPYAKAPTGELRFKAAVPPTCWDGELACVTWPPIAIQRKPEWPPRKEGPFEWIGQEDCLYLNIWTSAETSEDKLPVIFWIHGGGWIGGDNHNETLDGAAWAKKGVILVSVGYRLGPLGFLGLEELAAEDPHGSTGNYGLTDIIQALKWTKENIGAFGGDPENLTIAGQSSGGMAVKWLLGCPEAWGLFQRGIAQSGGGLWDIDYIMTFEEKMAYSRKALELVNWTVEDLRTRPAEEICDVLTCVMPQLNVPQKSLAANLYQPNMDPWLLKDYYGVVLDSGDTVDVELMTGTIRGEFNNFKFQVPGGIDGYESEFALCPGAVWAWRNQERGKKPVYHYFFDHDLPGENGYPRHASEMQFTFGRLDPQQRPWERYDYEISETAVDYWTSFAKTGDPNTPGRPRWNPWTIENPVTMRFANDGIYMAALTTRTKAARVAAFMKTKPGIINDPFHDHAGD